MQPRESVNQTRYTIEVDGHQNTSQLVHKICVKGQDIIKIKELMILMDPWFKTRINLAFNKATDVESVLQILAERKVHPEDVTQLLFLSEKMKLISSTVIFLILAICNEPMNE